MERPNMPVHDDIDANRDSEAINAMAQLIDWLSSEGYVLAKDPDDLGRFKTIQRISYPNNLKIIFDFFEYDYDAWLAEKDALVAWLNAQHKEVNDEL